MSSDSQPVLPAKRRLLTGLIGAPIKHSASPAMHERAAEALGLHCDYQLNEVSDAGAEELRLLLEGVRRLGFSGVNVTFPYKEAIVPLLDELSPGAAAIGAVNAVVLRRGRLIGHNTDRTGFAFAVSDLVARSRDGAVALIGAGGVGKAIAFALSELGVAELNVFDTDCAKAEALGHAATLTYASRITSRHRCREPLAWSMQRRWECCRAARARYRNRYCITGFGLPMRSIRRPGLRCCLRPRPRGDGDDRTRSRYPSGGRCLRTVHGISALDDGNRACVRCGDCARQRRRQRRLRTQP